MDTIKVAVFISGRGSNLKALLDNWYPVAKIALVVTDKAEATGLRYAERCGVPTFICPHDSRRKFAEQVEPVLREHDIDLIALAGFMRILDGDFVTRWDKRIINIHPSLLPAFPGLHPQRRALQAGVKITGCTVHYVVPEVDAGPIIDQRVVPVMIGDTEEILADRILLFEHELYPAVLEEIAKKVFYEKYGSVQKSGDNH